MGKHNTALTAAAIDLADSLGIKPSRTIKGVRALASLPQDVAPRKGGEGKRPPVAVPEIPEFDRRVVPTPSWVYVETSGRWGVVMEDEGRIFVTSAEPDADGQIDLTTLPKGKVVGVCGYWRYFDSRFPSVNWKLASYGLEPWEVTLGVTTGWCPELDTVWYMEELACGVNFYF
jgi:hypothetical protein